MFFPYKDDNPRILIPYVTYGIIAVNLFIFAFQFSVEFSVGLKCQEVQNTSSPYLNAFFRDSKR